MAKLLALVGFAGQHLCANALTGEMSCTIKSIFISATRHRATPSTAVTNLLDLDLAGLTGPAVAHLCTGVFPTV